jgi:MinD-like ATPase involved in chromosome partitioning or flagellar assembly
MSLVCLTSAHGSPGTTTVALCLAAVWPGKADVVLVEADPFGGVLAARTGLADTPGLVSLAAEARSGLTAGVVWCHAQAFPGGLPVVVGPPSAEEATAVLRDFSAVLADWAAATEVVVIVDCGRVGTIPVPQLPVLSAADELLVVSRPTADQLRPAAARLRALSDVGVSGRLLLVGDTPYGPAEVESALEVPVAGVVAFDPGAASSLTGDGGSSSVRRSGLVRSVATLADQLDVWFHPESAVGVIS